MAAIVDPNGDLDFDVLAKGLAKALPAYARPIFIRILQEMSLTGEMIDCIANS